MNSLCFVLLTSFSLTVSSNPQDNGFPLHVDEEDLENLDFHLEEFDKFDSLAFLREFHLLTQDGGATGKISRVERDENEVYRGGPQSNREGDNEINREGGPERNGEGGYESNTERGGESSTERGGESSAERGGENSTESGGESGSGSWWDKFKKGCSKVLEESKKHAEDLLDKADKAVQKVQDWIKEKNE